MATEIMMPQLGMGMFQGTILRWMVPDGAMVKCGDELLEIQTEKIIHTIEAPADGVVQRVAVEGEEIPVRGIIGYVLAEGEASIAGADTGAPAVSSPAGPGDGGETSAAQPKGEVRSSPIARRLAREHDLDLTAILGSGPGGRIVEQDVRAAVEAMQAETSPVTHPMVEESALDSGAIAGADPGGAVAAEDVDRFV